MKSLAGDFWLSNNDLQQCSFHLFHNSKSKIRVENEMILSHHCLIFCRSSLFLSMLEAALLSRQESEMAKSLRIPSTLSEGSETFWEHSSCGHPKVQQQNFDWFQSAVFSETCAIRTKSDHRQTTQRLSLLMGQFNILHLLNLVPCQN